MVVSARWDASRLASADGSAVELRIVGNAPGGGPSSRRTVEVGAIEWNAKLDASSDSLSELYFLRARYYDPLTGRFLGRDPVEFSQRYAYAGNNPVLLVDPSGAKPIYDPAAELLCPRTEPLCAQRNFGPYDPSAGGGFFDQGYLDLNLSFCVPAGCATGGFQFSLDQGIHPYGGIGSGGLGAGVSLTGAPGQEITEGNQCGVQGTAGIFAGFGPTGQFGGSLEDFKLNELLDPGGLVGGRGFLEGGLGFGAGVLCSCYNVGPSLSETLGQLIPF